MGATFLVAPTATAQVSDQDCPALAVVAARGSEQDPIEPVRYAPQSRWVSNGFEGKNIHGALTLAAARHYERTGTDLLSDVPVIAYDDSFYAAAFPVPRLVEDHEAAADIPPQELSSRVYDMFSTATPGEILSTAATGFYDSVTKGVTGAEGYIDAWERETGCAPDYLLIGYSQGAILQTALERKLADRGQLAGVFYLGNPFAARGVIAPLAQLYPRAVGVDKRLDYCLPGDAVCDFTINAVQASLTDEAVSHPAYFLEENPRTQQDMQVADTLAAWIDEEQHKSG